MDVARLSIRVQNKGLYAHEVVDHYEQMRRTMDRANHRAFSLCEALHDLLGQWDGRDPETDGPVDIEITGVAIRKAQAVLSEVE